MRPGGPVEFPHPSVPSNRVTRPSQLFIALAMKGCSQSVSPGTDTRPNRGGTSQRERCKADARVKTLQDRLKAAKDEFKARGVETAAGERFTVVRSETVRWSLDTAAVKAEMGGRLVHTQLPDDAHRLAPDHAHPRGDGTGRIAATSSPRPWPSSRTCPSGTLDTAPASPAARSSKTALPWSPTHRNLAIGRAAEAKPLQRRRNLSMIAMDLKAIWEMSVGDCGHMRKVNTVDGEVPALRGRFAILAAARRDS